MGEMSAQNVAEGLGALASFEATSPQGVLQGAQVGVQPGAGTSRFARMVIELPNGQRFTAQIQEV